MALFVALAVAALPFACSPSSSAEDAGASCPDDLPSACPSPAPTWSTVEPIVASRCWSCHADGGVAVGVRDLSSYALVARSRSTVLSQVYACKMPQPGAPPLTPDERKTMLAWLVCGAPGP